MECRTSFVIKCNLRTQRIGLFNERKQRFWYLTSGFENSGTVSANSSQSEYSTVSFLARALYNFQGKYFLNASFRDDASSRLPEQNRHQQFWAIGAAWDMVREDFMAKQTIFNALKLKGSVGVLGNQTASYLDGTPINYPFYPNLQTGTSQERSRRRVAQKSAARNGKLEERDQRTGNRNTKPRPLIAE